MENTLKQAREGFDKHKTRLQISGRSQKNPAITALINSIALQTNILALNTAGS